MYKLMGFKGSIKPSMEKSLLQIFFCIIGSLYNCKCDIAVSDNTGKLFVLFVLHLSRD